MPGREMVSRLPHKSIEIVGSIPTLATNKL